MHKMKLCNGDIIGIDFFEKATRKTENKETKLLFISFRYNCFCFFFLLYLYVLRCMELLFYYVIICYF